jgi:hypothetical protein
MLVSTPHVIQGGGQWPLLPRVPGLGRLPHRLLSPNTLDQRRRSLVVFEITMLSPEPECSGIPLAELRDQSRPKTGHFACRESSGSFDRLTVLKEGAVAEAAITSTMSFGESNSDTSVILCRLWAFVAIIMSHPEKSKPWPKKRQSSTSTSNISSC